METQTAESSVEVQKVLNYWFIPGFAPKTLKTALCKEFDIPEDQLFVKTRKREICNARQAYIYLIMTTVLEESRMVNGVPQKVRLPMGLRNSPSVVGRHVGLDHASTYHCIRIVQNFIDTEKSFRQKIERLREGLTKFHILMPLTPYYRDSHENN
jgi:chromosomal replication initiation ATPase DnaA